MYVRTARADEVVQLHIQALNSNPRLQHYVRIPNRICSCLDWFGIQYDRKKATEILNAYYLFVGIIDNVIDTISLDLGKKVLRQLRAPCSFSMESFELPESFITEYLKARIEPELLPAFLSKMELLYAAVCREQSCISPKVYVREREIIGELTAEISYLLLTPNFAQHHPEIRKFMMRVGVVGCLVDSFIDLQKDAKYGLIQFAPSFNAYFKLLCPLVIKGTQALLRYPRLIPLFAAAVADNIKDLTR